MRWDKWHLSRYHVTPALTSIETLQVAVTGARNEGTLPNENRLDGRIRGSSILSTEQSREPIGLLLRPSPRSGRAKPSISERVEPRSA
jgi:hypothetical protein